MKLTQRIVAWLGWHAAQPKRPPKPSKLERRKARLKQLVDIQESMDTSRWFTFDPAKDTCCRSCKYGHDRRWQAMLARDDRRTKEIDNLNRKLANQ